jgi:hypothetical protein
MRTHRARGFALVELLAMIAVVGVVGAGGLFTLHLALVDVPAHSAENARACRTQEQLHRLARELRLATNVSVPSPDKVSFTDRLGHGLTYSLAGDTLFRSDGAVSEPFLEGAAGLRFDKKTETLSRTVLNTGLTLRDVNVSVFLNFPLGSLGLGSTWYSVTASSWAGAYFVLLNLTAGNVTFHSATLELERQGDDDTWCEIYETQGLLDPRPFGSAVASVRIPNASISTSLSDLTVTFTMQRVVRAGRPHVLILRSAGSDISCRVRHRTALSLGVPELLTFATWSSNTGQTWSTSLVAALKQMRHTIVAREVQTTTSHQTQTVTYLTGVRTSVPAAANLGPEAAGRSAASVRKSAVEVRQVKSRRP